MELVIIGAVIIAIVFLLKRGGKGSKGKDLMDTVDTGKPKDKEK